MSIPNESETFAVLSLTDIKWLQEWRSIDEFEEKFNDLNKVRNTDFILERSWRHLHEASTLTHFSINTKAQKCRLHEGDWPDGKIEAADGNVSNIEITEVMTAGRQRGKEYKELLASGNKSQTHPLDLTYNKDNWLKWVKNAIEKKLRKNYDATRDLDILVYDNIEIFERNKLSDLSTEVEELFRGHSYGHVTVWLCDHSFLYRVWPNQSLVSGEGSDL